MSKRDLMEHLLAMLSNTEKLFSFFVLVVFNLLSVLAAIVELIKGIWKGKMEMVQVNGNWFLSDSVPLYLYILVLSVVGSMAIIHFNKLINRYLHKEQK